MAKRKTTAKVVSLTVHKNKREAAIRKDLRKAIRMAAKHISTMRDVTGFVVMGIDCHGNAETIFDTGKVMPVKYLPEFVKVELLEEAAYLRAREGFKDDYEPRRGG